jgi:hypothetical protein
MVSKARSVTATWVVTLTAILGIGLVALVGARTASASLLPNCAWSDQVGSGGTNGYDDDLDATYWVTSFLATPGAGLTVSGGFPGARYMSVTAYNSTGASAGVHLYDAQIQPATGVNRFQSGVSPSAAGTYQVQVVAQSAPANPAPNTLYVGQNNALVYVMYRIYDSGVASDPTGGVGLPTVSDTFNGTATKTYNGCVAGSALKTSGLLDALLNGLPAGMSQARADFGPAVSGGLLRSSEAEPTWAVDDVTRFPNADASYLETAITQSSNQIVVVQAQMPTFADTEGGSPAWAPAQVRYWSLCVDNEISEMTAGCLADHAAVESGGVATFVISTAANQPTNATTADGVNWLSWGNAALGNLVYRQLLAAPSFAQSIAAIPAGGSVASAMGAYYPQIAYCSVSEFESAGAAGCLAGTSATG